MSLLKKILGSDPEERIEEAREKEKSGDLGGAIMDYERVLEDLDEKDGDRRAEIEKRILEIRDALVDRFLAEAQEALAERDLEKALDIFTYAQDAGGSEGKRDQVQKRMEAVQLMIADAELADPERSLTGEEVFQALSGGWTQQQLDEFDGYGDRFKEAFLAYHAGRFDDALEGYGKLLKEAGEDALYLRLEYARALYLKARHAAGDEEQKSETEAMYDQAVERVHEFRRLLPMKRNPEVRAGAWSLLAQIYIDKKDMESAEDALVQAQEIMPEEPVVYLNLGRFLFDRERLDDAMAALEQGEEIMDKLHPNIELLSLLGHVHRQAGDREAAILRFQTVIDYFLATGRTEWDPAVARPLAELYEETGKAREASDIFRNLSRTGNRENLALYNYHAARLMKKLGRRKDEILPYLLRAKEHASDDELKGKVADLEKDL
jgi:tetratricopeptide (TPR) repeat protein